MGVGVAPAGGGGHAEAGAQDGGHEKAIEGGTRNGKVTHEQGHREGGVTGQEGATGTGGRITGQEGAQGWGEAHGRGGIREAHGQEAVMAQEEWGGGG